MNNDIVTIDIDNFENGITIAIDRSQTSVGFLAFGIISGALKAFYNFDTCKRIATFLAVSAGLNKGIEATQEDVPYISVANKVHLGIRKLFDGFDVDDIEIEVKRCCRYIIDELNIAASDIVYTDEYL